LKVLEGADNIGKSIVEFGASSLEHLDSPSKENVINRIGHHSIAYFACYGELDLADPSK